MKATFYTQMVDVFDDLTFVRLYKSKVLYILWGVNQCENLIVQMSSAVCYGAELYLRASLTHSLSVSLTQSHTHTLTHTIYH